MLENSTIARPYATAVFELARDAGQVEAWSATLELLSALVSDKTMRELIANPKVSRQQLQELVFDVCGDKLDGPGHNLGRNLVKTLVQAERLQYSPYIRDLYEQMRAQAEGKIEVELVTAYPLEPAQQDEIARIMAERLGKRVNVKTAVDAVLIGGAVIRAGDSIIDASLRGRLNEMHNELIR